ncbi:MAG: S-layer homology domain-containing protein [Oscillibacter sp.]|jgi:hypothetical protein|nr:S-layer homology domain-containing protein [Oscillibacter sp.]
MKKTLAAFLLALALLASSAAAFSDVDEGLYYAVPIAWAVERGISTGTSEDTFSPDTLCTQGQILTFLWRAAGSPQVEAELVAEMQDLKPDFQKAMAWGLEAGILDNADFPYRAVPVPAGAVLLNPSAPCTRGMAMSFLWRYAGSPAPNAPCTFTDVAPGAGYAQAVAWAVEGGITSGTSETTFSPNEPCTRGQIATFLYRCLNEAAPGETAYLPEDPVAPSPEPEEEIRPMRTYTGTGEARSLGLDGSEFTSEGIYEAKATVDIYSPHEAVFTFQVPFPLFQACNYTFLFNDPSQPEGGYRFTFLRWDEAFADILSWEGEHNRLLFSDMSGELSGSATIHEAGEEDRIGGVLVRRITFSEDSSFTFDRLDGCTLTCSASASQLSGS